jgi:hypothetical protein
VISSRFELFFRRRPVAFFLAAISLTPIKKEQAASAENVPVDAMAYVDR